MICSFLSYLYSVLVYSFLNYRTITQPECECCAFPIGSQYHVTVSHIQLPHPSNCTLQCIYYTPEAIFLSEAQSLPICLYTIEASWMYNYKAA